MLPCEKTMQLVGFKTSLDTDYGHRLGAFLPEQEK